MAKLIDADALEEDYRIQFENVYKHARDSVKPSDFFIERKAAYNKELMRLEMEAFCEYLQNRPTINAEPVRNGRWVKAHGMMPPEFFGRHECSLCGHFALSRQIGREELSNYCPYCGAKMELEE